MKLIKVNPHFRAAVYARDSSFWLCLCGFSEEEVSNDTAWSKMMIFLVLSVSTFISLEALELRPVLLCDII